MTICHSGPVQTACYSTTDFHLRLLSTLISKLQPSYDHHNASLKIPTIAYAQPLHHKRLLTANASSPQTLQSLHHNRFNLFTTNCIVLPRPHYNRYEIPQLQSRHRKLTRVPQGCQGTMDMTHHDGCLWSEQFGT